MEQGRVYIGEGKIRGFDVLILFSNMYLCKYSIASKENGQER